MTPDMDFAEGRKKADTFLMDKLADKDFSRMRRIWEMCEDVFAGETAVKSKDDRYIYRPVSKTGVTEAVRKAWEAYKGRGKLSKLPRQTLEKITGTLTANPPEASFGGKAAALEPMREDATPFGDGLDALFARTVYNVLKYGRHCMLLEPEENSSAMGFHISEYSPKKFLRAVPGYDADGRSFAKMVLLDTSDVEYDLKLWQEVYRPSFTVLALDGAGRYFQARLGGAAIGIKNYDSAGLPVYESNVAYRDGMAAMIDALMRLDLTDPRPSDMTEIVYPTKYGRTLDRIPFTCCNAADLNFTQFSEPPLADVCMLALHALNADCDHQQAIFLTTDPLPTFTGLAEKSGSGGGAINLTPDRALKLTGEADFKFVSPPGDGLKIQADNIRSILDEMRLLSLAVSGMEDSGNTSGVALELKQEYRTADIRLINQNCAKAIEEQLRCAGRYLGMDPVTAAEEIKYTPSRDIGRMKPTLADALTLAQVADRFTLTRQELREWAERNLGFEHRDFDEVAAIMDAERIADGAGAF